MALISLSDITLAFGGPPLFNGINLQIEEGDRLCLMGRNDSGKSTILKLIGGEFLFPPATAAQQTPIIKRVQKILDDTQNVGANGIRPPLVGITNDSDNEKHVT